MKTFYLLFLSFLCTFSFSQEFKTYDTGLIYSPFAMEKLKGMVGEKNEEFRVCDFSKKYISTEQAMGKVFVLNNPNVKVLKQDLLQNISLREFLQKFTNSPQIRLKLLTKHKYTNYDGDDVVSINERPEGKRMEINDLQWESSKSNQWAWNMSNSNYVQVAYLGNGFVSRPIPDRYSKMIQYSECLIDTTSQIFVEGASRKTWYGTEDESKSKQNKFLQYVNDEFGIKQPRTWPEEGLSDEQMKQRIDSLIAWEKSKETFVHNVLSKKPEFCTLLSEAYDEALQNKNSNEGFEYYAVNFLSPKQALALKRNRIVVGSCSMDNSPRMHAMNIAQLAGESLDWDIFLRAHLNILNDNFSRVSDGSYAWEGRQTYIKELEELNIHIVDLIIGIALRAENVAKGHYYGSISRLGRAIAESKEVSLFKDELPLMISDDNLDDFNRLLMFYVYDNLCYHQDTSENKFGYKSEHEKALSFLPKYLRDAIDN